MYIKSSFSQRKNIKFLEKENLQGKPFYPSDFLGFRQGIHPAWPAGFP
jgi:hypothetical protein